jgi:hypothetical protein
MKMIKNLGGGALLGLVCLGLTAASSNAADWDYSATFGNGLVVTGSFQGTQNGNFVDNISDITMAFNGTPVNGPLYSATFNGSSWVEGAVISFDENLNDFLFANSDIGGGNFNYNSDISFTGANFAGGPYAQAWSGNLSYQGSGPNAYVWTLVDPPALPDAGSTAALCGMSMIGLGWLRRKLS